MPEDEPTEPIDGLPEDHVPPPGEAVYVAVKPMQTDEAPLIVPGGIFTVTVVLEELEQPLASV